MPQRRHEDCGISWRPKIAAAPRCQRSVPPESSCSQLPFLQDVDAALGQHVVDEYQQRHGFDHGYRTGQYTWVVTALCFEFYWVAVAVDGLLLIQTLAGLHLFRYCM